MKDTPEHTLEFLLAFDGHIHWYADGHFAKFEIKRVAPTTEHPHGLRYSLTLHAPDGTRLLGFDNAHAVTPAGSRFAQRPIATDHWHRTDTDPGRPYRFKDASTLIMDFFDEVERVFTELGISMEVVKTSQRDRRNES